MTSDFRNLKIQRMIVHKIFKRDENGQIVEPVYNNGLSKELDSVGKSELQNRIITALGSNSHSIEMNISNLETGTTPDILTQMLYSNEQDYVSKSKKVAYKLAEAQYTRNIPGGVVVIINGTIGSDNNNFILVIKAEVHGGFCIEKKNENLVMDFLKNLLLTPQQKLYKMGIFIETNKPPNVTANRSPDEFKVFVYDHYLTKNETRNAAVYFYQVFLGCSIYPTAKKLTRDFYNNTKNFIISLPIDDEKKVDLHEALYSYLKVSQRNIIRTKDFAEEFLKQEHRDDYLNYMKNNNFPEQSVEKDLTFLANKLKRRKLKFSSGVRLSAPSDRFKELVNVAGFSNGKTMLEIEGKIEEQG